MRYLNVILVSMIVIVGAKAELMINAVHYDPDGTDSGHEWIELYNPDGEISLDGYTIEKGNGAAADDWTMVWEGSGDMRASSFYTIGEDEVNPVPDSIVTLGLQNGPDACRLLKNGTIIDTVGWGEHVYSEYYEGSPADDASALVRLTRTDTDNNSHDFSHSLVYYPHPQSSSSVFFSYEVVSSVSLESITLPDDDPHTDGYQITPEPGSIRYIPVNISLSGPDCSTEPPLVVFDGIVYPVVLFEQVDRCHYLAELELDYMYEPRDYMLDITAGSNTTQIQIEYLSMTGFEIDAGTLDFGQARAGETLVIDGDNDMATPLHPTLHNIGNTDVQFDTTLMLYTNNSQMDWSHSAGILAPGQHGSLTLSLTIDEDADPGVFTGEMMIMGGTP